MKRRHVVAVVLLLSALIVGAQEESPLLQSDRFLETVDMQTSLASLNAAIDNPELLQDLANRVLILDAIVASILLYSDDPNDYYAEVELVGGSWEGVQNVEMHRAYAVLTDGRFAGRLAERAPRDPNPDLILRNSRILLAARLVDLTEDDMGQLVPLVLAYEIRTIN